MVLVIVSVVAFFGLFFVLPMYLVLRKTHRGDVVRPLERDVDYDNPYGASGGYWSNKRRR